MAAACSDTGPPRPGDAGADAADTSVPVADEDGDGISDFDEGRSDNTDTDGDGTPDYLDDDSDGDGIFDSVEAGDADPATTPEDADSDGVPNFRDGDSDGNGIDDATEGLSDSDGDGREDFRDLDNDEDRVDDATELGDPADAAADFDGDGLPDWLDPDSDGDFLLDGDERPRTGASIDTDGDGTPDWMDDDSDGDGWTDAEEAGDMDIRTPPIDSDGDGIPNFRDGDSDGDGLGDADERTYGTDPTLADTDGDGVSDLVEISACPPGDATCAMDATDPTSNPRARGDFVFAEPYLMAPTPMRDTLVFSTDLRFADVYFLIDTTGSMSGPISTVQSLLSTPTTGIIDRIIAEISDAWFGVGDFKDYNAGSYGSGSDYAYRHGADITNDAPTVQAAVNTLRASGGFDGPESHGPAMYAVATGMGLPGRALPGGAPLPARTDCAAGLWGYPCFRPSAVPIIVLISDIVMHNGPGGSNAYSDTTLGGHAPTYTEVITSLTDNRVRVIGVATNTGPQAEMGMIATDTGAVDAAGMPLVSVTSSTGVADEIVRNIRTLANDTPLDISVVFEDDPADAVDTWAAFVDHLEANEAGDAGRGCAARMGEDTDADGFPDTFRAVTPGDPVCFDIIVKQNDTVMPTADPQLFRATLRVLGDGFTELDSRDVFFLVPPEVIVGGPD